MVSYPRYFFLHLLAIITLYVSVVSYLVLLFQYINVLLPDPLEYWAYGALDGIRWSTATLIIMFPVHMVASWMIHKDIAKDPAMAEYKIRKWLLTFTLFLAALVIIVDLITLIYNFLNGELSMRFLLKIAVVLVVAGIVFWYELWELRNDQHGPSSTRRTVAWGFAIVMLVSILAGFALVGSPFHQRKVRFDDRRVGDLQSLQYQIIEYWVQKDALPATVDAMQNPLTGFVVPRDPETGEMYEYHAKGNLVFELCANFGTDSPTTAPTTSIPYPVEPYGMEHWEHKAERTCFERTIDPELYNDRRPTKF